MTTTFDVPPQTADWYYCAVVSVPSFFGGTETDYVDGYASGDKPTRTALQEHQRCLHSWVAGMMYVDDEDVEHVAATGRKVTCEKCDRDYSDRDKKPLNIVEWTVKRCPNKQGD